MALDLAQLAIEIKAGTVDEAKAKLAQLTQQGAATEKQLGGSASRIGTSFSTMALRVGGALAAAFSVRSIISAIGGAEAAAAQLTAAIASTGRASEISTEQIRELAAEIQRTTTTSDDAVIAMTARLVAFDKISSESMPRVTRLIVDMATRMGTDLGTAAIQVGKALQDPAEGLSALARAGVVFSDEQKEVIEWLVKSGRSAEAQGLILGELEKKFAGAGEAARKNLKGALEGLHNAFDDLLEGKGSAPELQSAIEDLTATLEDPATKAGFTSLISGLTQILGIGVKAVAMFGDLGRAIGEFAAASSVGGAGVRGGLEEELANLMTELPSSSRSLTDIAKDIARVRAEIAALNQGGPPRHEGFVGPPELGPRAAGGGGFAAAAAEMRAGQAVGNESDEYIAFLESPEGLDRMQQYHEEWTATRKEVEAALPAHQQLALQLEHIQGLFEEGLISKDEYTMMVDGAKNASSQMTIYWEQAARSMQGALAQFLINPFKGGLKGMLQAFIQTLQQMVANAASAKILQAIFGSGSGGKSGLGGALGSLFSGLLGGGGKAGGGYAGDGGTWEAKGMYHGGEFIMSKAATQRIGVGALSAMNSGGTMGGTTVAPGAVVIHVAPGANTDQMLQAVMIARREIFETGSANAERRRRGRFVREGGSG